jgi:FkbM family methyltransferase
MRHLPVWIALAALLLAGCSEDGILETEQKIYSQHDEELLVRHFFDDRRRGFYLDVGAFEPRRFSTTAYLAEYLDWTGIAVDAQAELASIWRQMRPTAKFFAYIVTDHSGGTETLHLGGPISSVASTHLADLDEQGILPEEARDWPERAVEVETITLNDLLDREGVTKVDFLSMDIEQGEPKALAGFDIKRFRPDLVCIEAWPAAQDALREYFATNGYVRIEKYRDLDPNWWFKPAGAPGPD